MEKIEHILKFERKEFEEIDFVAHFESLKVGKSVGVDKELKDEKSTTTQPPHLSLEELISLLRSRYPTLFYASKRLEKVLIEVFSEARQQAALMDTRPVSPPLPLSIPINQDTCKVPDILDAVSPTNQQSKQTPLPSFLPAITLNPTTSTENLTSPSSSCSIHIFTLASLTRIPLLPHLAPFLLSQGTFTMTKGFRGRHFQPEPFTLFPHDLSLLLVELEGRGTRLRLVPSVSNLVTTTSTSQNTPLCHCLVHGHDDLVDAILSAATYTPARARIDHLSDLLTSASEDGDIRMVRRLLHLGAEINSGEVEWSALFAAACTNNVEICRVLVEYGAELDHAEEMSALYAASYRGLMEICGLLLEAGADVNVKNSLDGDTPIMAAVLKRHFDVVVLLTQSGADLSVKTSSGYSLLYLSVVKARLEITSFFIETCGLDVNEQHQVSGKRALHEAADKGRLDCCKLLVDHGAVVDAVDAKGNTALFYAAEFGHAKVCEYLISDCGASVNLKNDLGRSCVWKAVEKGNLEIVKILVEHTGPWILEEADKVGETPGDLAKRVGPLHVSNASNSSFSVKRSMLTLFVNDQVAISKSQSNMAINLLAPRHSFKE